MQLIAFLNKLLQLGIHPVDLSFLMGTASDSAIFKRLQKASKRLASDLTDDTAWMPLSRQICFGVVGASSGMFKLHLNVHIRDKQQQVV